MKSPKKTFIVLLCSLAFFCGLTIKATAGDRVSCMLDWFPNPDHAPLYLAQAKGFFAEEGLEVDLMV
ncbi:MAG: ABC transporter substrate-binding protein, partial [Syntrophobacterales bacterium]